MYHLGFLLFIDVFLGPLVNHVHSANSSFPVKANNSTLLSFQLTRQAFRIEDVLSFGYSYEWVEFTTQFAPQFAFNSAMNWKETISSTLVTFKKTTHQYMQLQLPRCVS